MTAADRGDAVTIRELLQSMTDRGTADDARLPGRGAQHQRRVPLGVPARLDDLLRLLALADPDGADLGFTPPATLDPHAFGHGGTSDVFLLKFSSWWAS